MNALDQLAKNELITKDRLQVKFLSFLDTVWGRGDARNLSTKQTILNPHWEIRGEVLFCVWTPQINPSEVLSRIIAAPEEKIRKTLLRDKSAYLELGGWVKQSLHAWTQDVLAWHTRMDIARNENPLVFSDLQEQYFKNTNREPPIQFVLQPEHVRVTQVVSKFNNSLIEGEVKSEILLKGYPQKQVASYVHEAHGPQEILALLEEIPDVQGLGSTQWRIKQSKQAKVCAKLFASHHENLPHLMRKAAEYREFLARQLVVTSRQMTAGDLARRGELGTRRKQLRAAERDVFGCQVLLRMAMNLKDQNHER